MAHKSNHGMWRVAWRNRGRRFSKNFNNKALADKFEAKLRVDGFIFDPKAESMSPTFEEFSNQWFENYCKVEKRETQWIDDLRIIRRSLLPAFGSIKLNELRKTDLENLKIQLRRKIKRNKGETFIKPRTVNIALGLAKKILATAVDWDLISSNPFAGVKLLKLGAQTFDYWRPDERDKFLQFCKSIDPDFYEIVLIACHTGLRWGELAGLQRCRLDFDRRMVTVAAGYSFRLKKLLPQTKNGEIKDVPMNELVYKTLKSRIFNKADESVFKLSLLDHPNRRLKKIAEMAGVKSIRFHDLRHTFASCLAMKGVPILTIKELMRHKSIQMTLRYSHLHPDHLRGATDVLCDSAFEAQEPAMLGVARASVS